MTPEIEQIKFRIYQKFDKKWSCQRLFAWKDLDLKDKIRFFKEKEVWLRCDPVHYYDFSGRDMRYLDTREAAMDWLMQYVCRLERNEQRKKFVPIFEYVSVQDLRTHFDSKKKAEKNDE